MNYNKYTFMLWNFVILRLTIKGTEHKINMDEMSVALSNKLCNFVAKSSPEKGSA